MSSNQGSSIFMFLPKSWDETKILSWHKIHMHLKLFVLKEFIRSEPLRLACRVIIIFFKLRTVEIHLVSSGNLRSLFSLFVCSKPMCLLPYLVESESSISLLLWSQLMNF